MALGLDFASLFDGLGTVQFELAIAFTFFVSWAFSRLFLRQRPAPTQKTVKDESEKAKIRIGPSTASPSKLSLKRKEEAERAAAQVMALAAEQFTRALQLYRQMVRSGLDKEVKDEKFYFSLIHASVRVGKSDVAGQLLWSMKRNGVQCTDSFFQSILKLFSSRRFFPLCRHVCNIFKGDLPADKTVVSCLAYAASESNDREIAGVALDMLRKAPQEFCGKDCVNLFRAFQKHGDADGAVLLLRQLEELKIPFDTVLILNIVLGACVAAGQLDRACEIMIEARTGKFSGLKLDAVSYNTLLKGYSAANQTDKCIKILEEMASDGVEPDDVTYSILVDSCVADGDFDLSQAIAMLDKLVRCGVPRNAVLQTTMINRFVKSNMLDQAMRLYAMMSDTGGAESAAKPDLVTFSILIKAHCDTRQMDTALQLLESMVQAGYQPDDLVVTHLLEGCCHVGNVALGERLFEDMILSGKIAPSVYTIVAMVKLYGRCGACDKALAMVTSVEEKYQLKPSVILFTCVMSGFLRNKRYDDAYNVFGLFKASGLKPDEMVYTTAIDACKQSGRLDRVLDLVLEAFENKVDLPVDLINVVLSQMLRMNKSGGLAQRLFDFMRLRKITCTVPQASHRLRMGPAHGASGNM